MHIARLGSAAAGMIAVCLAATASFAQFGTPFYLRVMEPDIRDAAPGVIPKAGVEALAPAYRHQPVFYRTSEAPGTIIVDTSERFLYLIQPNCRAIRYGIGVGRARFR